MLLSALAHNSMDNPALMEKGSGVTNTSVPRDLRAEDAFKPAAESSGSPS